MAKKTSSKTGKDKSTGTTTAETAGDVTTKKKGAKPEKAAEPEVQTWFATDEHMAQVPAYNAKWLDITLRTAPQTQQDRDICGRAIRNMYKTAGLKEIPRVVFSISPVVVAAASGVAAGIWCIRETPANASKLADDKKAIELAKKDHDAIKDKISAHRKLYDAVVQTTLACVTDKEGPETGVSIMPGDEKLPYVDDETYFSIVLDAALAIGNKVLGGNYNYFLRACIANAWQMRNGGNHWAAWCCYLSFVRDVVGWKHPMHEEYQHYELAAIHGNWRHMHNKFCVVSDFPWALGLNAQDNSHSETGPALAWRDGWAAWFIDGVRVDEQIVMRPTTQTPDQITNETNNEVRRIRLLRYGPGKYFTEVGAQVLDSGTDSDGITQVLMQAKIHGPDNTPMKFLACACTTTARPYTIEIPNNCNTVQEAQDFLRATELGLQGLMPPKDIQAAAARKMPLGQG